MKNEIVERDLFGNEIVRVEKPERRKVPCCVCDADLFGLTQMMFDDGSIICPECFDKE